MENTATAILAGLGTMLLVAAVVAGLVWLSYRLADRTWIGPLPDRRTAIGTG